MLFCPFRSPVWSGVRLPVYEGFSPKEMGSQGFKVRPHLRTSAPSARALGMLTLAASAGRVLAADGGAVDQPQAKPESGANSTPSLVQQFKDFISHPPVIKNLVFAKKDR